MAIADWEIWGCAFELIRQHGGDAALRAAMRADALLFEGELEGAQTWRHIVDRINRLEAEASGPLQ